MRRFAPAIFALAVCGAFSAACGGDSQASEQGSLAGRLPVVTTTTQLTDFVRVVGGNHVDVYGILKPNVDAHDFEPSPGDIARLAAAKVIVKNGVGLEELVRPHDPERRARRPRSWRPPPASPSATLKGSTPPMGIPTSGRTPATPR